MSLLADAVRVLAARGIEHAIIGAAALAAHGVARATSDLDLLVTDPACLDEALWTPLRAAGASVDLRRGDAADPLAGVIRIRQKEEATLDVIVGRHRWQADALRRALPTRIGDTDVPAVTAADLVLLKLYAGGPQDAWDIDQLLDAEHSLASEVETRLAALPADCAALWRRILEQRSG